MVPKLSNKHIEVPVLSKLLINLAAQVLSHSVATGIAFLCQTDIFPASYMAISKFVQRFESLVNIFNVTGAEAEDIVQLEDIVADIGGYIWKKLIPVICEQYGSQLRADSNRDARYLTLINTKAYDHCKIRGLKIPSFALFEALQGPLRKEIVRENFTIRLLELPCKNLLYVHLVNLEIINNLCEVTIVSLKNFRWAVKVDEMSELQEFLSFSLGESRVAVDPIANGCLDVAGIGFYCGRSQGRVGRCL
ncbi:hypothetical protein PoB_007172800 [Plakobranchus ocellatus]|uniref:Transposable element P transposase-like GTP-binding insertion domain-containing protein n=1 Tax=Plakobranchus ocellatus TaxID=259542 RepID=A0AAV4DLQ2_9GAST|nr:hypothetical protein PoB_007172800 [Plakobranchus ocellatus]